MHLITRISVIGIAITTAALVLLIAAFNGIEGMVERLYSSYDAPVTIRSAEGKTFDETLLDLKALRKVEGIAEVSRAVEEIVILKHQKKWVNARMVGIDSNFLLTADIEHHLVDGYPSLETNGQPNGIIGATLLDKLDGYISEEDGFEEIQLYTPLREAGLSLRKNPFRSSQLLISARMNYNREVNMQELLVPLSYAREQLNYDKDISAVYIGVKPGYDHEDMRDRIKELIGEKKFTVKTAAEKNDLIFKTSQSEKRIVIIILVFVFILAAFNLIASLTMLYIEKKDNVATMKHFGADRRFIFRIFFLEGLLIAARGIVSGIILGTGICMVQIYGKIVIMPNSAGEAFPLEFSVGDGVMIVLLVSGLSVLASFFPVRYLVRKS